MNPFIVSDLTLVNLSVKVTAKLCKSTHLRVFKIPLRMKRRNSDED
jgi:hypothetical protein